MAQESIIYLYRFELLAQDGAANLPSLEGVSTSGKYPSARALFLLTNFDAPVVLTADPSPATFLPAYTNSNQDWTFLPEAIEHEGIRLDGEKAAGQMVVTVPRDHALAQAFAVDAGGYQLWLTVSELTSPTSAAKVIFVGQAATHEYDEFRCNISMHTLEMVLARQGLTARHPRSCPYSLFDRGTCGVRASAISPYDATHSYFSYREDGFVGSLSDDGLTLTVPEAANRPNGFFEGGFLTVFGHYGMFGSSGDGFFPRVVPVGQGYGGTGQAASTVDGGHRRTIITHVGATLTLQVPIPPGDYTTEYSKRVSLFSGCDGALDTCTSKFSNTRRYGGYPFIPIKDPNIVGLMAARSE